LTNKGARLLLLVAHSDPVRSTHGPQPHRELDQAVKFLSQAIQLEPENEKNHYRRYRAHLRGKKYREALSDLSQSINLDPENGQKLAQRAK
jgi:tetratricopeptide (TPR) repeat protein